jgi:hypothetical protein
MISLRTYVSWNARFFLLLQHIDSWNAQCSFVTTHMTNQIAEIHGRNPEPQCSLYEHMIAEMPGVLFCYDTYKAIAEMHGWNLELQCFLHGHTIAEMHGVLFCYDTYDSWNPRTKSRAAMLSLRTYDSWNARCSSLLHHIRYLKCTDEIWSCNALLTGIR